MVMVILWQVIIPHLTEQHKGVAAEESGRWYVLSAHLQRG